MSIKLCNTLFSRFTLLILMLAFLNILVLASDNNNGSNNKTANAANSTTEKSVTETTTTSTTTTITTADLNMILSRLAQAEQVAQAAQKAAEAAKTHADALEVEVKETRLKLTAAESQLQELRTQSESLVATKRANKAHQQEKTTPPSDGTQNPEEPQENTDSQDTGVTLAALDEKVAKLEDMVEVHDSRLKEDSRTYVETGQKFNLKLSGTLLFNTYYNTAGTDDPPTGLYLLGRNNTTLDNGSNFGATIRQTQIGFAFSAPKFGRWRLFGDVQMDFFGGNPPVYNGRAFSPLRIRIARGTLATERFSLTVGQDDPIISPLNPTSLAQVGFPALAESGNLWSWTPQAKVAYKLISKENERLTIEGGILAPYNGQTNTEFQFETRPDAGERSRMPALETRLSYQRGDLQSASNNAYLTFDPEPFQVGLGVHYGRQLAVAANDVLKTPGTTINSVAVAGDYIVPLGKMMTLKGEVFWGRSLGGLGGGIVQGIVFPFYGSNAIGVRSIGGWSQLQIRPTTNIAVHLAYGLDDPYNKDLAGTRFDLAAGTSRAANRTFSGNILYRLRNNFIISAEYRFMQTHFTDSTDPKDPNISVHEPSRSNNHINIGFAYSF